MTTLNSHLKIKGDPRPKLNTSSIGDDRKTVCGSCARRRTHARKETPGMYPHLPASNMIPPNKQTLHDQSRDTLPSIYEGCLLGSDKAQIYPPRPCPTPASQKHWKLSIGRAPVLHHFKIELHALSSVP